MNIHNTSHITRSAPDELVPSRYAVKVGDIDVLVVSDGCRIFLRRIDDDCAIEPKGLLSVDVIVGVVEV